MEYIYKNVLYINILCASFSLLINTSISLVKINILIDIKSENAQNKPLRIKQLQTLTFANQSFLL